MRLKITIFFATALALSLTVLAGELPHSAVGGETSPQATPSPIEIMQQSQLAFHYPGEDMKAEVTMDLIDRDGDRRTRVMTMLRIDEAEGRDQKYFIYFYEPGDVRRMTFMVWKDPEQEDDRWIFIPAVDLVRRIAADDKRSSFVGSDFTYEDVSGRDVASDEHTLIREERLGDRDAYVVESQPKASTDYTRRLSWIDKVTFLPLREEYFDAQQDLFRIFTADEIVIVSAGDADWPTVISRTMSNIKTGHRTETRFTEIEYDLGLDEDDFSERRMRQPPRSWIR